MKFNVNKLIDENKENEFTFFWGHQPSKDGNITKTCFSQWWLSPFVVDKVNYYSAEHWMMEKKAELFNDQKQLQNILNDPSPANAKKYGRKVKDFDSSSWEEKAYLLVVEGNFHKFSQNLELAQFLLLTKDSIIVEASPFDAVWGIGTDKHLTNPKEWRGANLLGFALMEVRGILKKNSNFLNKE